MAPSGHRRNLRFSSTHPLHGRYGNTYKLCRTKHCSVRYNANVYNKSSTLFHAINTSVSL